MKAALVALWILSLGVAFGLARWTRPDADTPDPGSIDSLRSALEQKDPLTRSAGLGAFLETLEPEELPATLETLEQHRIGVTASEVRLLMLAWSRFDAPGAFAWARDHPGMWKDTLMEEALFAWGFRDGRAALAALQAIPEDEDPQRRLRRALVNGWILSDDREGVSAFIAGLPQYKQVNRLGFLLAGEIIRDGVDAVIGWAEGIPEDAPNDFKGIAFYHAAGVVARRDPQRAARWYEAHRGQPYVGLSLEVITRKWAEYNDPRELFEWLRSLPRTEYRPSDRGRHPVGLGFKRWHRRAPEEAEAWLGSALPDPFLDPAVVELVRVLARSSPLAAIEWAERIDDETGRRSSLVQAGREWRKNDPDGLRAWLAASDLPEPIREQMLRGPQPRRAAVKPPKAAAKP